MPADPTQPSPPRSKGRGAPAARGPEASDSPWRVYVSGFLDWPRAIEEAAGFDAWRCRENASGYLFIGRWHEGGAKPNPTRGPLPRVLRRIRRTWAGRAIDWTFDVLPTRWGIADSLPAAEHDVVVSLGLGVYPERFGDAYQRTIVVEVGARNLRARGPDVAGVSIGDTGAPGEIIDPGAANVLRPRKLVRHRAREAVGPVEVGDSVYTVVAEAARDDNAFICNETHYSLLTRVESEVRLDQAYFIHVPRPRNMRRGRPLAKALGQVIEGLIQP